MFSRSAELYDFFYSFKDYAGEATRLHELIQAHVPAARTLLDVACGTGKHLAELAGRYEVEGVDIDPRLLAIAHERLPDVPLHEADMVDFELGRRFDAVTCLFSSVGYMKTTVNLGRAVAAMARHVRPGGLLVVEPWILPENWQPAGVDAIFVDEPELKAARINRSLPVGDTAVLKFHYLVGRLDAVEHFTESHELGMFAHDDYVAAFESADLVVEHDGDGLMGRGLYIGAAPEQALLGA